LSVPIFTPDMRQATNLIEEADEAPSHSVESCAGVLIGDERWSAIGSLQAAVTRFVEEALKEGGCAPAECLVSVALLSDEEVRVLNETYRGKDKATNVLSFPSNSPQLPVEGPGGRNFLGDVVLAYETVMAEASTQEKPPLAHLAHLVVHGTLHLQGYSHDNAAAAERMEAAERAILQRLGMPDPYAE
jgi:probable rRNA maturation factor